MTLSQRLLSTRLKESHKDYLGTVLAIAGMWYFSTPLLQWGCAVIWVIFQSLFVARVIDEAKESIQCKHQAKD